MAKAPHRIGRSRSLWIGYVSPLIAGEVYRGFLINAINQRRPVPDISRSLDFNPRSYRSCRLLLQYPERYVAADTVKLTNAALY